MPSCVFLFWAVTTFTLDGLDLTPSRFLWAVIIFAPDAVTKMFLTLSGTVPSKEN
jgi:predicted membrane protein